MHRREVDDKAQMGGEPFAHLFPMMGTDIVAHQMNRADMLGNLAVQVLQKSDEFLLPLAGITLAIHLAGTGVKGREEIEGSRARSRVRSHMWARSPDDRRR
jgi:hypothetical protein